MEITEAARTYANRFYAHQEDDQERGFIAGAKFMEEKVNELQRSVNTLSQEWQIHSAKNTDLQQQLDEANRKLADLQHFEATIGEANTEDKYSTRVRLTAIEFAIRRHVDFEEWNPATREGEIQCTLDSAKNAVKRAAEAYTTAWLGGFRKNEDAILFIGQLLAQLTAYGYIPLDKSKFNPLLVEKMHTEEEVVKMIKIAHAIGWNDGRNQNIIWSDSSMNKLKEQILQLFKINL